MLHRGAEVDFEQPHAQVAVHYYVVAVNSQRVVAPFDAAPGTQQRDSDDVLELGQQLALPDVFLAEVLGEIGFEVVEAPHVLLEVIGLLGCTILRNRVVSQVDEQVLYAALIIVLG